MKYVKEPRQIGEIMRELFIIRPDGTIDYDMVIALARASQTPPLRQRHLAERSGLEQLEQL